MYYLIRDYMYKSIYITTKTKQIEQSRQNVLLMVDIQTAMSKYTMDKQLQFIQFSYDTNHYHACGDTTVKFPVCGLPWHQKSVCLKEASAYVAGTFTKYPLTGGVHQWEA